VCDASAAGADDNSGLPWKPWDRDKDLSVTTPKPKTTQDLLKMAGSLSGRFASGR
jgi:hypothetical protein